MTIHHLRVRDLALRRLPADRRRGSTGAILLLALLASSLGIHPASARQDDLPAAAYAARESETWSPTPLTTWQYQINGSVNTSHNVVMYDLDLFETPQAVIDTLHAHGRIVVAYFRAGVWEDWRPDAGDFPTALLGNTVSGWSGERWLNIANTTLIHPRMEARLDLAVAKGFDGVEPSDVDGYHQATGFPLTAANQLSFNQWLAGAAHLRGLSVGLKNDREQIAGLATYFDWALEERLYEYDEASLAQPFLGAGKAVFDVEYSGVPVTICPPAIADHVSLLFKTLELGDEPLGACPGAPTGVHDGDPGGVPGSEPLRILSVAPNPFAGRERIAFEARRPGPVSLSVHDVEGREVTHVALGSLAAGRHWIEWDGRDARDHPVPAGVYLVMLRGLTGVSRTTRVIVVR